MTTEELRSRVEVPHKRRMWGQDVQCEPKLVTEVFGDGKKLICLTPTNTRPNYYVVRVDSTWSLSNWADGELFIDHLDDIYEAIEDEYGRSYDEETEEHRGWPALSDDSGSSWGEIDWAEYADRSAA
jgi:hypothetical protein